MNARIAAQTARTLPDFEVVEFRDQNVSVNWEYATAYLTSERGSDLTAAYDDFRRELEADRKEFIFTACNAHDDLVAALRKAILILDGFPIKTPALAEFKALLAKVAP